MKTINEQIVEKQDELIAYLIEEGTFTHFAIAGRSKIISELSALKQQAEQESNNQLQSEDSANNLKTAEEILNRKTTFTDRFGIRNIRLEYALEAMEEYTIQFKQEKVTDVTDEGIDQEAHLRYGEINGGQYHAARHHDMAIFRKGAKWMRDKMTKNK